MICPVCQADNEAAYQRCSRCGASADRRTPTLLVLGSMFTREAFWGITVVGLTMPLLLLVTGLWGAWAIWQGVGFTSYWSIVGFALLAPGTIFTLSLFPVFRRVQSALIGLGFFVTFGLLAAAMAGLFLALVLFFD